MAPSLRLKCTKRPNTEPVGHRSKRAKTRHLVDGSDVGHFKDIQEVDAEEEANRLYFWGIQKALANGHTKPKSPKRQSTTSLVDLKSVPSDPCQQSLWIAQAVKKYADHGGASRGHAVGEMRSPRNPSFKATGLEAQQGVRKSHRSERSENMRAGWVVAKSGTQSPGLEDHQIRSPRDTRGNAAKHDAHSSGGVLDSVADDVFSLPPLKLDPELSSTLFASQEFASGDTVKSNAFGKLLIQSLLGVLPTDKAASLKSLLDHSQDDTPFIAALRALGNTPEVVNAINTAFKEAFETKMQNPGAVKLTNGVHTVRSETGKTEMPQQGEAPRVSSWPKSPGLRNGKTIDSNGILNSETLKSPTATKDLGRSTLSSEMKNGLESHPPVETDESAKATTALQMATGVLEEMAYGASKLNFAPYAFGAYALPYGGTPPTEYMTPYAQPPHSVYITPYGSSSPTLREPVAPTPQLLPKEPNRSDKRLIDVGNEVTLQTANHGSGVNCDGQKGRSESKRDLTNGTVILESAEEPKDSVELPQQQDGNEKNYNLTQELIDGFLALANGGDLIPKNDDNSIGDYDSDRTISRSMTHEEPPKGDPLIESVVEGIIKELMTNQNWGHGIAYLTPHTAYYQTSNAARLAADLRRYIDEAALTTNVIVSAEQSRAQSTLYAALIKRISNPYEVAAHLAYSSPYGHTSHMNYGMPGATHPSYQYQPPPLPPPEQHQQQYVPQHSFPQRQFSQQLLPPQHAGQEQAPPEALEVPPSSRGKTRQEKKMIRAYGKPPLPGSRPGEKRRRTR